MTHDRVVVPLDGSTPALEALAYASQVFPDASFTLVHVIDPFYEWPEGPGWTQAWEARARERAASILETGTQVADEHGVSVETAVGWGAPYREILRFTEAESAAHLVMGSTGQTMTGRMLLGGVAETVVKRSPIPVTLVRFPEDDPDIRPPSRVLTPLDGSDEAFESFQYALELFPAAEHFVLSVCELDIDPSRDVTGTYLEERCRTAEEEAEAVLVAAQDEATSTGSDLTTETSYGRPTEAILAFVAEERIDHIVMGRRGRSKLQRLMMGSVAETVSQRAPVPVTVYR